MRRMKSEGAEQNETQRDETKRDSRKKEDFLCPSRRNRIDLALVLILLLVGLLDWDAKQRLFALE